MEARELCHWVKEAVNYHNSMHKAE